MSLLNPQNCAVIRDWSRKETYDGVMSILKEHGGAYGQVVVYAETMLKK